MEQSNIERRALANALADIGLEDRSDGLRGIRGVAAAYYNGTTSTEFRFGKIIERILPGAFSRSLDNGDDVLALINHNQNLLLGRRSSKTLRLTNTDAGLRYSIDTPNTSFGRDLIESISRGDLRGSSFAFTVNAQGETWRQENDLMVRELRDINLHDVSVVAAPAYEATSVDLRSAFKQWEESRKVPVIGAAYLGYSSDLARRKLRLIELQAGL